MGAGMRLWLSAIGLLLCVALASVFSHRALVALEGEDYE